MREEREAGKPAVWAFAGAAPHSGSGIAAFLLGGVAAQSGRETQLFRPGQWETPPKQHYSPTLPLHKEEMADLLSRLSARELASAQGLYHYLLHLHPQQSEAPLWLLELGCSRSHAHWDLFWSCDLPLLVTGSRDEAALQKMADSAWQRWLERALALDEDSLHARRLPADLNGESQDYLSSSRLRQLGKKDPLLYVVFDKACTLGGHSQPDGETSTPKAPLKSAGVLSCDSATALMIRDLHAQFNLLPHAAQEWLLNRLEEKLDPAQRGKSAGSEKRVRTLQRGVYTQLDGRQILNIDLNFFDVAAVVSPFAATDDEL
ncbi:MAG TPA: hypothetical protein PLO28_11030 [bacterium]|nr:hypothetical protein [bacterium]